MLITIRINSTVSKRKIMKSRFTRAATSGDVGPYFCAASSIRPSSGPTKPTPTSGGDHPADEPEDDPELAPVPVALAHQRDAERDHDEERRGVDLDSDPGTHLPERCKGLAVLAALEHDAERGERDVSADPDDRRDHVDRHVDLVGRGRERQQDDRTDEQEDAGGEGVDAEAAEQARSGAGRGLVGFHE